MKTIKLALMFAAALAAPSGLFAREELAAPGEPAAVSSATVEARPAGLVQGYRGVSIPVAGDQLLYVKKGDRVDLLVTFEAVVEEDRKEILTASILQNVIVINVSKPEKTEGTGAIELLLNPNEAQYAALSVSQGKSVTITVRAPGDVELHPMEMASFRKLIR